MAGVKEIAQWENHVYRIEENDPVHGGEDGITNKPIKHLANRTLYLRRLMTEAGQRINPKKITAESRNSNDLTGHSHEIDQASTTVKGIVQLGNEINSNAEDKAATLKAVKTAYDKGVEALGVANTKQSPATTLAGYGITDFVVQSATGDLNTYRTDGIYSFNSRGTTTNAPPNKTGHLIVIAGGPGNERWSRQLFKVHYTGETYERWQTSGSDDNWSDWQRTDITLTLNNTLTSTATDQALTAAQGKVLKDLIDAVQGIANGNAGAGHLHVIADITGLQNALNGKANSSHNHGIGEITGLQNALNNKANDRHNHGISEIAGLQNALNGKANSSTTFAGYGITNSQQLNGDLRLKSGDYSSIQLENNSRRYVQIESQPDNSGDIAHIIYKTPIGDNLKRVKIKKQNGTMLLDSDLSSSVTSNSDTEPASVAGVKIAYDKGANAENRANLAYDKGVEAKNRADEALRAANAKQSPATTLAGYGITDGVRQDEFVYQKIGNFEIRKYPDGTMTQTYTFTPSGNNFSSQLINNQSFTWAVSFVGKPKIFAQHINMDANNDFGSTDITISINDKNTTHAKVTFSVYEIYHNRHNTNIDFLAMGRWR